MALMEKRYAEALVEFAVRQNAVEDYGRELQLAAQVFAESPELRYLLLTPGIGADVKKAVVTDIFGGKVRREILHLLLLLMDKRRIKALPGILEAYGKLADSAMNILNVTIISAVPLEQEQLDKIKEKCGLQYKAASVKAEVGADQSLIGGVKLRVGDKVTDGTVKGRLEALRKWILEN